MERTQTSKNKQKKNPKSASAEQILTKNVIDRQNQYGNSLNRIRRLYNFNITDKEVFY